MATMWGSVLLSLLLLLHPHTVPAARILLLPFPWKSHVFEMSAIGEELQSRGHELSIVLPPSFPDIDKMKTKGVFEVIQYVVAERDIYGMETGETDELLNILMEVTPIEDFRQNIDGFTQLCSNPLSDNELYKELQSKKFDLAIVDAFPCSRCYFVFPYRLGIPQVALTTTYEPWLFRTPSLPSFVPFPMAQYFTERMTFWQRASNLYTMLDWSYSTRIPYLSENFIRKYIPDKPFRSLDDLARDSKLWLFDTDILLDYPRPTMPNEINIGGLSTKPANKLPDDLLKFVEDAKDGFIVVSFGSFDVLTKEKLAVFLDTFREITMKVVLRTTRKPEELAVDVPNNVRLMTWIPQNDLLGHPKCLLFITHCGANGQFEALYHGVPMIGFPIYADQPYNARRAEYHGFGLHLNLMNFDSGTLISTINKIVKNETFYEKIEAASEIFHARIMSPRQRAAFWVEEVLNHGVDYLRSHAVEMPWYEYLMLDVMLMIVSILFTVCWTFCKVANYILRRCGVKSVKHKSE